MSSIVTLSRPVSLLCGAAVGGRMEQLGPLGEHFDEIDETDTFGMTTWEQAESEMQRRALNLALDKAGLGIRALDAILAGDLINQCTASGYGLAHFDRPYFGLYGACSTVAEAMILGGLLIGGGHYERLAAVTSSHNCASERQFRFPIEYGGQRTPTAQWTVTAAGALILASGGGGPYIRTVLPGRVTDRGIADTANMGAAMAPAAIDTLGRYFRESGKRPGDFSAIFTGDLGMVGSGILTDLLAREGFDLRGLHYDCGMLIYDRERQDVHAGGSGCGCAASVLACHILPAMREGKFTDVLFVATGAMMSPDSVKQGLSIPGIAHLLHLSSEAF